MTAAADWCEVRAVLQPVSKSSLECFAPSRPKGELPKPDIYCASCAIPLETFRVPLRNNLQQSSSTRFEDSNK